MIQFVNVLKFPLEKKNEKPNRTIISNKTRKTQLLMLAETEKYQNKLKSLKKSKPS